MAKNAKQSAQVKGRQTKLGKKSSEELIEIILRKDKTERNLNNQVLNLKGEVNTLTTRVNNFDKDMEGTYQALEAHKDQVKTLQEKNDALKLESNEIKEELKGTVEELHKTDAMRKLWKAATILAGIAFCISIVASLLF